MIPMERRIARMNYIKEQIEKYHFNYDVLSDTVIRFYYKDGSYTGIEVTELGFVCIKGEITDFNEWIERVSYYQ